MVQEFDNITGEQYGTESKSTRCCGVAILEELVELVERPLLQVCLFLVDPEVELAATGDSDGGLQPFLIKNMSSSTPKHY